MLFILLIIFDVCYIYLTNILITNNNGHKTLSYLFLAGFNIYSGFGIFLFSIDHLYLYFANFCLLSLAFFFTIYRSQNMHTKALSGLESFLEKHRILIIVFAVIYVVTFIYPLFLGKITVSEFFNIKEVFENYRATPFSVRLERKSNFLYSIIVNQLRSITRPFFYLYLYNIKDKHILFIISFILPIYCMTIADGYLSRNNIAVYFAFVILYLIDINLLSKKFALVISCAALPFVLALFYVLANVRLGNGFVFSINSLWENVSSIIETECGFPKNYDLCASLSSSISAVNYIIYIFIVCIPSQFYSLFGFSTPNLAYSFTEAFLGLTYGSNNYYIVLPSVLGEALMLFGDGFAWIYGFIYGACVTWFFRVLKSCSELRYLYLFFLLDFLRQFRGGSQYVISAWMTTLIPFIIIVFLTSRVRITTNSNY